MYYLPFRTEFLLESGGKTARKIIYAVTARPVGSSDFPDGDDQIMFIGQRHIQPKFYVLLILIAVTVLSAASVTEARNRRRRVARTLWEYNVVTILHANTEQRKAILNEQGRMGWELISSEDDKTGTGETTFYLKRLRHRRR